MLTRLGISVPIIGRITKTLTHCDEFVLVLPRLVNHVLHVIVDGLFVGVMGHYNEGRCRGTVLGEGRGEGDSGCCVVSFPVVGVEVEV